MRLLANKLFVACLSIFILCFTACDPKDEPGKKTPEPPGPTEPREADEVTQKINNFIVDNYKAYYLWNDKVPKDIDVRYEDYPAILFYKMRYSTLDKWSSITDKADAVPKPEGVSNTYGYKLLLGEFDKRKGVYFAVVMCVYPNSPAETAGLERGDIIMYIDGQDITDYEKLFSSASLTVSLGKINPAGTLIEPTGEILTMTAEEIYLDPVNTWKVIEIPDSGEKIGYLCYTDYVVDSYDKLVSVFEEFQQENVTDVILDLRCNNGGASRASCILSSILAPVSVLDGKTVYLNQIWNKECTETFNAAGTEDQTIVPFDENIRINMDLSRVYVLTSENTASASEATIVSLMPYMEVIQIGKKTYGKYCGSVTYRPKDADGKPLKDIGNWALNLVVYKFANATGYTDFVNGLPPTYEVNDPWQTYHPFGNENDPLIAKAIKHITGDMQPEPVERSAGGSVNEILPPDQQPSFRNGGMRDTDTHLISLF